MEEEEEEEEKPSKFKRYSKRYKFRWLHFDVPFSIAAPQKTKKAQKASPAPQASSSGKVFTRLAPGAKKRLDMGESSDMTPRKSMRRTATKAEQGGKGAPPKAPALPLFPEGEEDEFDMQGTCIA